MQTRGQVTHSVGGVILNPQNQILLMVQARGKFWEFPKGKIEKGERQFQTLRREIFEEAGIRRFRICPKFRYPIYFKFRLGEQWIHRTVTFYLLRTRDRVQISKEHLKFAWFDLEAARKKVRHKNYLKIIDAVERYLADIP